MIFPTEEEKKQKANAGGSQFADASQYISQNQPQAQRLASNIGNNIVQQGNVARQNNQNVQQNFSQQVQSSRIPYNEAIANRAAADPRSFYTYQRSTVPVAQPNGNKGKKGGGNRFKNMMPMIAQQNTQAVEAPVNPVSEADIASFQKMQKGEYAGPQDLTGIEGYGNLSAQENAAAQAAENVGSEVGREDLLKSVTGKPINALDAMLLGGGQAQSILGGAAAQNDGIDGLSALNNEKAIAEALAAKQANAQGAAKIDEMMFGPQGAFNNLKDMYTQTTKKTPGGGKDRRAIQTAQKQDYAQQLDALNRLMGTKYTLGGY